MGSQMSRSRSGPDLMTLAIPFSMAVVEPQIGGTGKASRDQPVQPYHLLHCPLIISIPPKLHKYIVYKSQIVLTAPNKSQLSLDPSLPPS